MHRRTAQGITSQLQLLSLQAPAALAPLVIVAEITGAVGRMNREEFTRWVELLPEHLAERGPPRPYGRPRWRRPQPQPTTRMRDISARCNWMMSERDLQEDRRRQADSFLWPPTEDIGGRPPDRRALREIGDFRMSRPGHPRPEAVRDEAGGPAVWPYGRTRRGGRR